MVGFNFLTLQLFPFLLQKCDCNNCECDCNNQPADNEDGGEKEDHDEDQSGAESDAEENDERVYVKVDAKEYEHIYKRFISQ